MESRWSPSQIQQQIWHIYLPRFFWKGIVVIGIISTSVSWLLIDRFLHDKVQTTYAEIAGLLRLSTKYDIEPLRKEVISYLKPFFPTDLRSWMSFSTVPFEEATPFSNEDDLGFLSLFSETNVQIYMPAALMWCCFADIRSIISPMSPSSPTDIPFVYADRQMLLVGREELLTYCRKAAHDGICAVIQLQQSQSRTCDCRQYLTNCIISSDWQKHTTDAACLFIADSDPRWVSHLCALCSLDAHVHFQFVREELWQKVPSFFGLAPWEELLRQSYVHHKCCRCGHMFNEALFQRLDRVSKPRLIHTLWPPISEGRLMQDNYTFFLISPCYYKRSFRFYRGR